MINGFETIEDAELVAIDGGGWKFWTAVMIGTAVSPIIGAGFIFGYYIG